MSEVNSSGNLNNDEVFDSTDDFFDKLDQSVAGENPAQSETVMVTQKANDSEQVTRDQQTGSNNAGWDDENNPYKQKVVELEKRYADSSRAGQANYNRLKEVEPFLPVLDAMKKDSGLVEHVKDYLVSGGTPAKSVQEKLGVAEDFEYDANEAMSDPNSDSAKVFGATVDNVVQQRVGQILETEKQKAQEVQARVAQRNQALEFQKKKGLTDAEMGELMEFANKTPMTLDHVYTLKNMGKRDANIANSTKEDMMNQMKQAQNMPQSASGANSQNANISKDDQLFASLFGDDLDNDNLFG
tara:strand:- start:8335 stop:9231 length:897 start_codon:yes stop_codon:yes gene_type:complete